MRLGRRGLLTGTLAALGTTAHAQGWPDRPLTLLVGFPPGTATDTVARLLAERLTGTLGQRVLVDNRPGLGGSVATQLLARAAPDGFTLAVSATAPLAINPHLYANVGYDPVRDFTPVGLLVELPYLLVTGRASGIGSVAELVAAARGRPVTYGSTGNGTTSHLLMALLGNAAGVRFEHVPYRGSAQVMTDLLAGRLDATFDTALSILPQLRAGGVRGLAVGTAARVPQAPEVPTIGEAGYPAAAGGAWLALIGPAGLPAAVVARLNEELGAMLGEAASRARIAELGAVPAPGSPGALAGRIVEENRRWAEAIRLSGARVD